MGPNDPKHHRRLLLFACVLALLLGARAGIAPLRTGLDPSFVYAYNHASVEGEIWGTEFVSTYGPLGYLINALDLGSNAVHYLLFHLLFALAAGLLTARLVGRFTAISTGMQYGATALVIFAFAFQVYEWPMFALLVVVLLLALNEPDDRRYFLLAGVLSGAFLLIKFTLGFGALATSVISALFFAAPRRVAERLGLLTLSATVVGLLAWIIKIGSPAGIFGYLDTGRQISSGYSSAMGLQPANGWVSAVCFLGFFALSAVWGLRLREHGGLRLLVVLAFPLFTGWKHAMVRQDGHVAFLTLFGLFAVLLLVMHSLSASRQGQAVTLGLACASLLVLGSVGNGLVSFGSMTSMIVAPVQRLVAGHPFRLLTLGATRGRLAETSTENLQLRRLSPEMRGLIGDRAVDIYPWEIAYIPANELRWKHRPIPTSFSVYTPQLDDMNAAYLESDQAPPFLLWHHDVALRSIDGRYLLHDEPETLQTLLNLYEVERIEPEVTLLRRRDHPRFALGESEPTETAHASWGEWVDVPWRIGGLRLAVERHHSLAARFKQFAYRQDPIFLSLRLSDGNQRVYRAVPENLASGIWIAPFPSTVPELWSLLEEGTAPYVIAVRFDADAVTRMGGDLTLSWEKILVEDAGSRMPEPPSVDDATFIDDGCAGAVEAVAPVLVDWGRSTASRVSGWAHAGKARAPITELWLADEIGRPLAARVKLGESRPDVAAHYSDPRLAQVGWTAVTDSVEAIAEIGFIARLEDGNWIRSCNRLPVESASTSPD